MKKTILAIAVLLSLSACSGGNSDVAHQQYAPPAQAPVAAQPAPVIVQQAAPEGNNDALLGAAAGVAAGYMLGRSNNTPAPSYDSRPVVHKTIVNKTVVVQQAPKPAPAAPVAAPKQVYTAKPAAPSFGSYSTYKAPARPSYTAPARSSYSAPSRSYSAPSSRR